mgnify:CR=1 FL=1
MEKNIENTAEKDQGRESIQLWQEKLSHFYKNKFALTAGIIVLCLYILTIFAPFFAPYSANENFKEKFFHPPTKIHFSDQNGLRAPFIYETEPTEGLHRQAFQLFNYLYLQYYLYENSRSFTAKQR